MKNTNPLYIAVLIVVLFLFSVHTLYTKKNEMKEISKELQNTKKLALDLNRLEKEYSKRVYLQNILNNKVVKKSLIVTQQKSKTVIKSNKLNLQQLNFIFNKILNARFNINKLKIQKTNKNHAKLYMEILW